MGNQPFLSDQQKAEWKIFFEKLHFLFLVSCVGIQIYAVGMVLFWIIEFLFSR